MKEKNITKPTAHEIGSLAPTVDIDPRGNLVLDIHQYADIDQQYRVSISALCNSSAYFNTLLDPHRFSEGAAVHSRLTELTRIYDDSVSVPSLELPKITIQDIGQIPIGISSQTALRLFLDIIHRPLEPLPTPRIHVIAKLVLIGDRFDATKLVSSYMVANSWLKDPAKQDKSSKATSNPEVLMRQKLLIGLIAGFAPWVYHYSATLINEGSTRWTTDAAQTKDEAPWWHLPYGVEGKRGKYVDETVESNVNCS